MAAGGRRPGHPPASRRVRRARSLVLYWRDGRLTFENYLTRSVVSADPLAVGILERLEDWRTTAELASELAEFQPASVRRAIAELLRATLVVREGTDLAGRDEELSRLWRDWLPQASFHFATKDTPFASPRTWARLAKKFRAESPQPPLYKRTGGARTALPAVAPVDDAFTRVLLARKTHREFSGEAIPLASISALLHYTWGVMGYLDTALYGKLLHKTSPSGGARHPGECYLVAQDVRGLRRGVYHYDAQGH